MSPQKILITGGSQGIGLAIARDLAASGHPLWICARSQEVFQVAREIGSHACQMDVADAKSVQGTFSEIHRNWDGPDALIHAAAELGESGSFWDLAEDKFAATLMTNTAGSFQVTKAFVRSWIDRAEAKQSLIRRGKIILFAGGGAGYGYPRFLPYGTSKAAVVRMCETMAMELHAAKLPIDINVIAPGANETRMLAQVRAAGGEVRTVVPFSKPITLVRWLLSSESDGVSGRFLHVNDAYNSMSPEELKPEAFKLRRCE